MKKTLTMLICFLMLFAILVGCGAKETAKEPAKEESSSAPAKEESAAPAEEKEEAPAEESYTIGFAIHDKASNNYAVLYFETFEKIMKEKYPQHKFIMMDSKYDSNEQINHIDNFIAQECDAVIIWPVNSEALVGPIQRLHDAGIPVVVTNTPVAEESIPLTTCYTGPNSYDEAVQSAEMMIEALPDGGNVVELGGTAGFKTSIQRHDGFADTLEGTNITLLDHQPADWSSEKAQQIMQTYLATYGDEIDGIYCADDGIAAGVHAALDAVGKDDGSIKIVSCTMFGSGYDRILDGTLYGSVFQSPVEDATICINSAVAAAAGEPLEADMTFETQKITKANIDTIERPIW